MVSFVNSFLRQLPELRKSENNAPISPWETISGPIYVYRRPGPINTVAVASSARFSIYVRGSAYLLPLAFRLRDLRSARDFASDNDRLINDRPAHPARAEQESAKATTVPAAIELWPT